MAIDMRFRPPVKGFLSLHVYERDVDPQPDTEYAPGSIGREVARSVKERSLEILFEEMDEAGITRGVMPGRQAVPPFSGHSNEDIYDLVREYPNRLIGLPNVDPSDRKTAFEEIDRAANSPEIPGIHMEPGWLKNPLYADDPTIYPIYQRCGEKNLIVAISAGGTIGPDFSYVNPVHIQRVAKDFPEIKFVVCHGGWPWIDVMIGVAYACPNVYVSPDMYMTREGLPGKEKYVEAANLFMGDRLLFGSAYPVRSLKQSIDQFHLLPFKDEELKEKVLSRNAKELLGIK